MISVFLTSLNFYLCLKFETKEKRKATTSLCYFSDLQIFLPMRIIEFWLIILVDAERKFIQTIT